ncbi:ankyrin repeat domain protein [Wolbachia endosymbiont of Culex quinquefasciatus JHB]|uniref:ankyrin repeat domain-containing protein n=1 Tax=unclassified Wolbachia TaxID=2640676 RepID=UPI0001761EE8|nr:MULTISPECIES: ankyrin repeat domain-containing protein [unclassified Wolbachia]EEB56164.1 ankyrin repeat domain protein [Wolbachia endosymbiont of Culex quinquefasciatus JHB]CAQ54875.1 ankyrin repeat domain protein [Wolbachia endosymbiont of Culex quinquefasciatus Pel]CQD09150.1 ankyrin repeat domain protein [Wolbachia endosymbiont wPip_Mol of Culex molestus]
MNTLLEIVCRKGIRHNEKITELKEFLNKNIKIPIDKELFKSALSIKDAVDIRKKMVYLILHHCIEYNSAISEKKEKLSFQDVMKILDETVNRFITPQYFYKLINFQDQSSKNTLLHQAVISNNTEAIEALLKYGASPLIKNKEEKIPLDLDQEEKTREALIKSMKDQAKSKKESARCNSLIGIIPGVFLGIGLGVGSALVPSMTIILCTLAVSALVAGIAVGVAIYFLSQDYKQAKSIEEAVNPQLSSVKYEKTVDNKAVLG